MKKLRQVTQTWTQAVRLQTHIRKWEPPPPLTIYTIILHFPFFSVSPSPANNSYFTPISSIKPLPLLRISSLFFRHLFFWGQDLCHSSLYSQWLIHYSEPNNDDNNDDNDNNMITVAVIYWALTQDTVQSIRHDSFHVQPWGGELPFPFYRG